MVVAIEKNKSTDDKNSYSTSEVALQFAVHNLEHILQLIEGRLEFVETS